MNKNLKAMLVAAALLAPVSALAVPITVDFTVTGTGATASNGSSMSSYNGYALGTLGSGSFTIDDSVGNYSSFTVGLTPIVFQFDWLGVSFNESSAQLYVSGFLADGAFNYWQIGFAGADTCGLNCVSSVGCSDFYVTGSSPSNGVAAVHQLGVDGFMTGTTAWNVRASVPEPATLALFGMGLLGMGVVRRRRQA